MVCSCCRKDLGQRFFDPAAYKKARIYLEMPCCFNCSKLDEAGKKKKVTSSLKLLNKKSRKKPKKTWGELPSEIKREELYKSRSKSEKIVEGELFGRRLDFDTQVPVGPFFVDFHILPGKLAVEIDGGYHGTKKQSKIDAERTEYLERQGWEVMRFTNEQVSNGVGWVVDKILEKRDGTKFKNWVCVPKIP